MSYYVSLDFSYQLSIKSGQGRVKYVFLGLRRQLRYQAEGKNISIRAVVDGAELVIAWGRDSPISKWHALKLDSL
jgi:hypothetical protein